MISMNKLLLASAIGAVLSLGAVDALACTTAAWDDVTGAVNAASPTANTDASPKRYGALCGLQTVGGAPNFVTNDTPGAESTYRARFYVYTGTTTAAGRVFSATSADGGGGSEVIGVSYNPTAATFSFSVNGTPVAATAPAAAKRWHGIEVAFVSGTSFDATVKSANPANPSANIVTNVSSGAAPAAATVGSARLGNIDGVASSVSMNFDEFDSTRGSTAIGFLCRGDANNDGTRSSGDTIVIRNEFFGYQPGGTLNYSAFQPDCNEDGVVNSGDAVCVRNIFFLDPSPTGPRACTSGL